jgi:hypothetical protein
VTFGSWLLIDGNRFLLHSQLDVRVQSGTKINFPAKDFFELLSVAHVTEANTLQRPRFEFRKDIDVAPVRVKVIAQHGSEQAQPPNPPGTAKRRDFLVVQIDGQVGGDCHIPAVFCVVFLSLGKPFAHLNPTEHDSQRGSGASILPLPKI